MQPRSNFKSNLERDFHREFALPYETTSLPYTVVHHYRPDWQVGPTAFIETKGMFTGADRSKHLHIKKQHPHIKVLLVFQDPWRRLSKTSKTTYSQWCDLKGIEWCSSKDVTYIRQWMIKNT